MSAIIEVSIGRVASITKANAALNLLEVPFWSVAVSDGFYHKDAAPISTTPKYLDALFYPSQGDAWAESAYLLGKRPDESEAVTARRRSRSVDGGVKLAITMSACGRMGIGRVAGDYNSAGTNLPGYDDPAQTGEQESDEVLAVAAVEHFKTTQVGLKTDAFPHVFQGEVTMRKAEVVAERAGKVNEEL